MNISEENISFTKVPIDTIGPSSRHIPSWYLYLYVSLCGTVAVLGIMSNMFLFYTILRVRRLHKPTNLLLLSLTVADLMVCSLYVPLYIIRFHLQAFAQMNEHLCLISKFLFAATTSLSLWSLAIVSLDRMIAISYPFFYEAHANKRTIVGIVVIEWIFCLCLCSVCFYPWSDWKKILPYCGGGIPKFFIITIPGLYLPAVIMILAYFKIFLISRKHLIKIRANTVTISEANSAANSPQVSRVSLDATTINSAANTPQVPRKSLDATTVMYLPDISNSPNLSQRRRAWSDTNLYSTSSLSPDLCETRKARSSTVMGILAEERKPRSSTIDSLKDIVVHSAKRIRTKTHEMSRELAVDLRAAKTVGIIVGTCSLGWIPTAVYNAYVNANPDVTYMKGGAAYMNDMFLLLAFINSLVNPVIYTCLTKDIRKSSKKILMNLFKRKDDW